MTDDREMQELQQRARERAQRMHDDLVRAQATADALPPLTGIPEWAICATCGTARTKSAKKMPDGTLIPICGNCAEAEMDEYEARQRAQRNTD